MANPLEGGGGGGVGANPLEGGGGGGGVRACHCICMPRISGTNLNLTLSFSHFINLKVLIVKTKWLAVQKNNIQLTLFT